MSAGSPPSDSRASDSRASDSRASDSPEGDGSRPPLGSWPKFYVLTCVVASLYIVLLYWFTATFNDPGAGS